MQPIARSSVLTARIRLDPPAAGPPHTRVWRARAVASATLSPSTPWRSRPAVRSLAGVAPHRWFGHLCHSARHRWSVRLAAAAVIVLCHGSAASQEVSPLRLKAFLIWNIAKLTSWPPNTIPPDEPFTVCVLGNAVVADVLQETAKQRRLTERRVVVWHSKSVEEPPAACQVLFVSGMTSAQLSSILSGVRDRPVLSISDIDGSGDLGVIVQFVYEGGQLAYRVGLNSAKRARLQLSAPVLRYSR